MCKSVILILMLCFVLVLKQSQNILIHLVRGINVVFFLFLNRKNIMKLGKCGTCIYHIYLAIRQEVSAPYNDYK